MKVQCLKATWAEIVNQHTQTVAQLRALQKNIRRTRWRLAALEATVATLPRNEIWPLDGEMQPLPFSDVEIALWNAREELFAYERRLLCARSEVKKAGLQANERIAQSSELMVRADALMSTICYGRATGPIVVRRDAFEPAATGEFEPSAPS